MQGHLEERRGEQAGNPCTRETKAEGSINSVPASLLRSEFKEAG